MILSNNRSFQEWNHFVLLWRSFSPNIGSDFGIADSSCCNLSYRWRLILRQRFRCKYDTRRVCKLEWIYTYKDMSDVWIDRKRRWLEADGAGYWVAEKSSGAICSVSKQVYTIKSFRVVKYSKGAPSRKLTTGHVTPLPINESAWSSTCVIVLVRWRLDTNQEVKWNLHDQKTPKSLQDREPVTGWAGSTVSYSRKLTPFPRTPPPAPTRSPARPRFPSPLFMTDDTLSGYSKCTSQPLSFF